MSGEDLPQGPATNLLRSLVRLGGTLLATAQTRVELLTTEISEDVERGVRILLWGFVALLAGIMGLLLAGVTLIIHFWDTHRMGAALAVTFVFLAVAAIAAWVARDKLHEKPRLLDATRTELRRDVDALRERAMSSRLVALTARRAALQAECALQRDDAAQAYAEIAQGALRADRVIGTVRRLTPLLVVAGAGVLLAVGPARALSLVSRGIALRLYVQQARGLLG